MLNPDTMNPVLKTVIRNVLFVFVLVCIGSSLYLFEAEAEVIATGVIATALLMKVDEYNIRRKRRLAARTAE